MLALDLSARRATPASLRLVLDDDDDDDNGVRDADDSSLEASDELLRVRLSGVPADASIRAYGGVRLVVDGRPRAAAPITERTQLALQGVRVSRAMHDAGVEIVTPAGSLRVPITVVSITLLDANNRGLDPSRVALGVSRRITHAPDLPRDNAPDVRSDDPENVRVEVEDASSASDALYASLRAARPDGTPTFVLRHLALRRVPGTARFRSGFVRLVADRTDLSAPDVAFQLLRVRLRDRVRVQLGGPLDALTHDLRVGRPGREGGERGVYRGRVQMHVLRFGPGGAPVVGDDDEQAIALAREQIEIANEIWAQCFIDFGDAREVPVRVIDPPRATLIAVSDLDGLPARGDGEISFAVAGRPIGPIRTHPGARPEDTALSIARELRARGFAAEVSVNTRTAQGAHGSADVIVRDARGRALAVSAPAGGALSSDSRQRIQLGRVELSDGIREFDNLTSAAGTLEERALVKLIVDRDPRTIDMIVINHFVTRERQGEAFIEADGSIMANTLIFDRNAVRFQRQAWVQAHELGHVLLDEAFHPDNVGPDRPFLLMDSNAREGRVTGPKRLSDSECEKARRRSGPDALPPLLFPAP